MRLQNTYEIKRIVIDAEAKCYCPLGKDWYTNHFAIEMELADFLPDYCDVDDFVAKNINGKEFIIEKAVALLYDYIKEEYRPAYCKVTSFVDDATHSAVTVEKY